MLKVLFTLDYEIHGNGEGSPLKLMIEPTQRLLRLFDEYGAKLTIMADVAESLKFKEYAGQEKRDDYHYGAIVSQLQDAVARGHDVQLHIHSSYFNATHDGRRWVQDWREYDFAGLDPNRMTTMVKQGKQFLESILQPAHPGYRCLAFRAANWSVSPSRNVVRALLDNGLEIDTSIFKYGRRDGLVKFDYSRAHSDLLPWPACADDLCARDDRGKLWEFPIYSENRWIGAFLSANRIYRVLHGARHRIASAPSDGASGEPTGPAGRTGRLDRLSLLAKKHAWKADFNQCTGRQLMAALRRAEGKASGISGDVPFVLIGHSKIFNTVNERSLRPFLEFVAQNKDRFGFETFGCFHERIGQQNFLAAHDAAGGASGTAAHSAKAGHSYVLVTPAQNEEATVEITIRSVLSQTILPKEWIIVSDRSTDRTEELVKNYAASHDFIRLLRVDGQQGHSFASVVHATEAGLKALKAKDYAYVGLLDADVRFAPEYYEKLMQQFERDPKLGLAGGLVLDVGYSQRRPCQNLTEIAGATQFFTRACFESLGGLLAIPEGGWDAVTCVRARMNGFRTATFHELVMDHLKPRSSAYGNWWRKNWLMGARDYALGNHPAFEIAKCCGRVLEPPVLLGAAIRLCGYVCSALARKKRVLPDEIAAYIQREQMHRLCGLIRQA